MYTPTYNQHTYTHAYIHICVYRRVGGSDLAQVSHSGERGVGVNVNNFQRLQQRFVARRRKFERLGVYYVHLLEQIFDKGGVINDFDSLRLVQALFEVIHYLFFFPNFFNRSLR
jgi:hypothetical protein